MIASTDPDCSAEAAPPAKLRAVELYGPAGRLEALLNEGSAVARFAALVCHPHPKGGGSMHNKVVYHATKVLNGRTWGFLCQFCGSTFAALD
jgi:alpha/beta superfamily hydrolase